MPLDPSEFHHNEAWILFRLNAKPICTQADGDFDALAIKEVMSGVIFGMKMVSITQLELPELLARNLLASAEEQAGGRASMLFIANEENATQVEATAAAMKIEVKRVPAGEFADIAKEARDGFARHVVGRGR